MADDSYVLACNAVTEAFQDAYAPFVAGQLERLGYPGLQEADEIFQGKKWLTVTLREWSATPSDLQRQGPLQIFQAAMAFPTAALSRLDVAVPWRPPQQVQAMPGDTYGLAPASSRQIDDGVWSAHVAWGIAKAKEVANVLPRREEPPVAALAVVASDQGDRAALRALALERGLAVHVWRNPGAIDTGLALAVPLWAVVDADHQVAGQAVRQLAGAGCHTCVFGESVDDVAKARWMSLGAAEIVERSNLMPYLLLNLPAVT